MWNSVACLIPNGGGGGTNGGGEDTNIARVMNRVGSSRNTILGGGLGGDRVNDGGAAKGNKHSNDHDNDEKKPPARHLFCCTQPAAHPSF